MARVIRNKETWHALTIAGDDGGGLTLVKGGRLAYLSCDIAASYRMVVSISGQKTLRRLALAILKEVGRK